MQENTDFPSLFNGDNFTSRRTTGHNLYDPECLITGAEINKGMTYVNSKRNWPSQADYLAAVSTDIPNGHVPIIAPRRLTREAINHLSIQHELGMREYGIFPRSKQDSGEVSDGKEFGV